MISFKGRHFPKDIILMAVRWKLAYPLSYRNIEEMMAERGIKLDHSTVQKWVVKYSPELEEAFRKRKKRVGVSWRMDETYLKIKGEHAYLYRAVDKEGKTIDFKVTEKRDRNAAMSFFEKAIGSSGLPDVVNIDKSGSNTSALNRFNMMLILSGYGPLIMEIRRVKYLNNIVEQDHRSIKKITKYMLGFKTFKSTEATIAGIELCHMIKKGQMKDIGEMSVWDQFYCLAA